MHFNVLVIGDNWEDQLLPYCSELEVDPYEDECYCLDEDKNAEEDCEECNGTGKMITTSNPNGTWDEYELGGRWSGYFKLIPGCKGMLNEQPSNDRADQAKKGYIDFEAITAEKVKLIEQRWEEYINQKNNAENIKYLRLEYGVKEEDTKEIYLRRWSSIATSAVLKFGEWYEPKGFNSFMELDEEKHIEWDKQFNRLLSDVPDNVILTIVDCHL
jgi:hypothetical protein